MRSKLALWMYCKALDLEPALVVAHVNAVEQARQEGCLLGVKHGQNIVLRHQSTVRQIASRN